MPPVSFAYDPAQAAGNPLADYWLEFVFDGTVVIAAADAPVDVPFSAASGYSLTRNEGGIFTVNAADLTLVDPLGINVAQAVIMDVFFKVPGVVDDIGVELFADIPSQSASEIVVAADRIQMGAYSDPAKQFFALQRTLSEIFNMQSLRLVITNFTDTSDIVITESRLLVRTL